MGMRRSARWKGKTWLRSEFIPIRFSQARCNAREILDAASAMFHAVEGPVGGGQKLFGRVAIFRKCCSAGAGGQSRGFRFRRHPFVDAADDAGSDIRAGFGKYYGELVSTITRRGVDRAAVVAKNFSQADEGAASSQMPVAVVDGLETVHVEENDAEGTLRAARAIELSFNHAEQTSVVGKTGERIADRKRPHLIKQAYLVEQRTQEHDQVACRLGQFGKEKRPVKKVPGKSRGKVAKHVQRGNDEKRIVVNGSGFRFPANPPAKSQCSRKKQRRREQIPGAREQTCRMRTWSRRRGQECGARTVCTKRNHQKRNRDFLARLTGCRRIGFDCQRRE